MQRLVVLSLILVSLPVFAQVRDNEIGIAVGYADMGDFGDAGTFAFFVGHYFRPNLSVELELTGFGAELATVDIGPGGDPEADGGDFEMGVLSASLRYHWLRGARLSPYVGAGIAFVNTELVDTPFGDFEADRAITGLGGAGVDIALGSRWALNGDVTYMPHTADFGDVDRIEVNPLTLSAGVKVRW